MIFDDMGVRQMMTHDDREVGRVKIVFWILTFEGKPKSSLHNKMMSTYSVIMTRAGRGSRADQNKKIDDQ